MTLRLEKHEMNVPVPVPGAPTPVPSRARPPPHEKGQIVTAYHFDDAQRDFVLENPLPPRPWINYLGNRRLRAFISQNGGGLLWQHEPKTRRITRYHYIPAPADRPGFYVYLRDAKTGTLWNPHFAPSCTALDRFECRHGQGVTTFSAEKDGISATVTYGIAPDADVMLWRVTVRNGRKEKASLAACSYLEFGLLEFMREMIGWCYLKSHIGFTFDRALNAIKYDYHVFEAPVTPRMFFACTHPAAGWECSRDRFVGQTGSLADPNALRPGVGLSNSELPAGGHGAGCIGVNLELEPGAEARFAYAFIMDDTSWDKATALVRTYSTMPAVDAALAGIRSFWNTRLDTFQAQTGDADVDRCINIWNPYNATVACEVARSISVDHMGTDGLRYRDTTQDALAVAAFDPEYALERMRLVFGQQTRDGGGCFAFYPLTNEKTSDAPHRSDNTVWPVDTMCAIMAETGSMAVLDETIPYRDGGSATIHEHLLHGLRHIAERCGPHGLPTFYHADWNDGLALYQDEKAESVMLGLQMVHACTRMADLSDRRAQKADAQWCRETAARFSKAVNADAAWDGAWYRRLILGSGRPVGSRTNSQGQIYIEPQVWAVMSGAGMQDGRGRQAMDSVAERLDTDVGIAVCRPAYRGFPDPTDPPLGSNPGTNENGGVFCHANTWAIIAECLLGRGDRAWKYYHQMLPSSVIRRFGIAHYEREPYVFVSTILGPDSPDFGRGGIGWLTGTASWMYVAATQYILGIRPELDGLRIQPCLPGLLKDVRVTRRFRGAQYDIRINHAARGRISITANGKPVDGTLLPPAKPGTTVPVIVEC